MVIPQNVREITGNKQTCAKARKYAKLRGQHCEATNGIQFRHGPGKYVEKGGASVDYRVQRAVCAQKRHHKVYGTIILKSYAHQNT